MKNPLVKTVRDFLHRHFKCKRSLLLGYSGGPDSRALLYLLLECQSHYKFDLHLAHVDHGWRKTSKKEAKLLCKEAEGLKLPFHLLTLKPGSFKKGNLEEQARDFRLAFFSKLYSAHDCQALLLAHQADDQAEIVLKRVCEGAHLSRLCGLSEVTALEKMQIWRPLLSAKKKELTAYLERRGLSYFTDITNTSPRFLRGRMRTELLPLLAKGFGKEIIDNFCHLGRAAESLKSYFIKKISGHLEKVVVGEQESYWDIPQDIEEIELQFLLKEWFTRENILASREVMNTLVAKALSGGVARFPARGGSIYINRKCILILKNIK